MIVSSTLPVDRQVELAALQTLLQDAQMLNKTTSALTKLEALVASANELSTGGQRPSFMRFVTDRAEQFEVHNDRISELLTLCDLLHTLRALDASVGVLGTLRSVIATAEKLTQFDLDTGRPSLMQFIVELLHKERT